MKNLKALIAILLLTTASYAGARGGGGYDFTNEKPLNVMILREAAQSAVNADGVCNTKRLVLAISAAMFESPSLPSNVENSAELTKEELACWKKAVQHIAKYNESMGTLFKAESERE